MRKWLISGAVFVLVAATALWVIASILSTRYEPYIRNAAVRYLQERFESEVELGDLKIRMPQTSTLRLLVTRGRGAIAEVEGRGLTLRHMARRDLPPMFAIKHFRFAVNLAVLFEPTKRVPLVELDGMEIYIPPKGERPKFKSDAPAGNPGEPHVQQREEHGAVLLEEVRIRDATLVILPRDQNKVPLRFDIQRLQMKSVGKDVAMTYEAELTNPQAARINSKQRHLRSMGCG